MVVAIRHIHIMIVRCSSLRSSPEGTSIEEKTSAFAGLKGDCGAAPGARVVMMA
jgi:hypothetical protein